MKYGNCLIGLVLIMLNVREEGRVLVKRERVGFYGLRPRFSYVHYFYYYTRYHIYDYCRVKDILPWPFCYFIFEGEFRIIERDLSGKRKPMALPRSWRGL